MWDYFVSDAAQTKVHQYKQYRIMVDESETTCGVTPDLFVLSLSLSGCFYTLHQLVCIWICYLDNDS